MRDWVNGGGHTHPLPLLWRDDNGYMSHAQNVERASWSHIIGKLTGSLSFKRALFGKSFCHQRFQRDDLPCLVYRLPVQKYVSSLRRGWRDTHSGPRVDSSDSAPLRFPLNQPAVMKLITQTEKSMEKRLSENGSRLRRRGLG